MKTAHEMRWRSFCWFEGIRYKPEYGGEVWLWHYRNYKASYSRDTDREMLELSA